ncbi:hypothetical protein AVEN_141031-1, partial [Araneus ventricosus]
MLYAVSGSGYYIKISYALRCVVLDMQHFGITATVRLHRRPSPMSTESHKSSSDGEDRRWIRRGGITGNGDLPLITISQASEGRDSMSSLNSSEEGTPPSSATSFRRPGLIPSVSEQEEDEYVEEDEELSIEIQDHTHFEPIRDAQENGGQEEVTIAPETMDTPVKDTATIKSLTGNDMTS